MRMVSMDKCDTPTIRDAPVESEWMTVGGNVTYVVRQGIMSSDRPLILIIPGNPGVADYYTKFIEGLQKFSNPKLPICCVSHAGHVTVPPNLSHKSSSKFFNLEEQIEHKLEYIREFVPSDVRLILVGHSIGCYMILKMLKSLKEDRIVKCFLLFPTIERMSQSESGRIFTPFLKYFRWFLPFLSYPMYYLLPDSIKQMVLQWHFKGKNVPQEAVDGTLKLASPTALGNSAHLANIELQTVNEADYDCIGSYIHKLFFYYGSRDHWCPIGFYENMKSRFPDGDIYLCTRGFEHAFVLESSFEMAELVWSWLNRDEHAVKN